MKDIFRYCKKYIAYFLVVFLFSFLISSCEVKAYNVEGWAVDNITPDKVVVKDCISSNSCNGDQLAGGQNNWNVTSDNGVISQYVAPYYSNIPNDSNGAMFIYMLNTPMLKDYLYTFTAYFCSPSGSINISNDSTIWSANSQASVYNMSYPSIYSKKLFSASLSGNYFSDEWGYSNSCVSLSYTISPQIDSAYIGLRLNFDGPSNNIVNLMGYSFDSLGLYSSSISSIIDNANFASSESIEEVQQNIDEVKKQINDLNDSINNSDSSGASSSAGGFFEDFTTDTFGLTAVITAPLNFIKSLTSSSCKPLNIPLPFVDTNLTLPCMSTIYNQYFGGFYTLYQTITTGLIAYWVCVRIFNLVKDFKNPDHDEIEVMDL